MLCGPGWSSRASFSSGGCGSRGVSLTRRCLARAEVTTDDEGSTELVTLTHPSRIRRQRLLLCRSSGQPAISQAETNLELCLLVGAEGEGVVLVVQRSRGLAQSAFRRPGSVPSMAIRA